MERILFRVHLKNGRKSDKLYESQKDWSSDYKLSEILKIENVRFKVKTKTQKEFILSDKNTNLVLMITNRTIDDINLSKECSYTTTYKYPSNKKVFTGMKFLEVSEDYVLIGEVQKIESYNKEKHFHWKGPGYKPNEEWVCVIFHSNSVIKTRNEIEKIYGKLKGTQGGITYLKEPVNI